jgi:hypothetical protein
VVESLSPTPTSSIATGTPALCQGAPRPIPTALRNASIVREGKETTRGSNRARAGRRPPLGVLGPFTADQEGLLASRALGAAAALHIAALRGPSGLRSDRTGRRGGLIARFHCGIVLDATSLVRERAERD